MIGDLRTDALHQALASASIDDEMLIALLIFGYAGTNVSITSGSSDNPHAHADAKKHAARLVGDDGSLVVDHDTLQQVARALLIDVMSCRRNRSDSGIAARIAGSAIGADTFLPNMASDAFFSCLSRAALEATAEAAGVPVAAKVKDTRAALIAHFADGSFVHPASLIAPAAGETEAWAMTQLASAADAGEDEPGQVVNPAEDSPDRVGDEVDSSFNEAAE